MHYGKRELQFLQQLFVALLLLPPLRLSSSTSLCLPRSGSEVSIISLLSKTAPSFILYLTYPTHSPLLYICLSIASSLRPPSSSHSPSHISLHLFRRNSSRPPTASSLQQDITALAASLPVLQQYRYVTLLSVSLRYFAVLYIFSSKHVLHYLCMWCCLQYHQSESKDGKYDYTFVGVRTLRIGWLVSLRVDACIHVCAYVVCCIYIYVCVCACVCVRSFHL